jgi:hypothetical protein
MGSKPRKTTENPWLVHEGIGRYTDTSSRTIKSLYEPGKKTFRNEETVELVCDPLSLQDWTPVWDKLKPKIQPSVAYVARMIAIESDIKLAEAVSVQTRGFDMAQVRTQ